MSTKEDGEAIIHKYLHGAGKSENRLKFLKALTTTDPLTVPFSKVELVEAVLAVMESLPVHSMPSAVLSSSVAAISSLSKQPPPLEPEPESCVLRAVLHSILTMDTRLGDVHTMDLYQSLWDLMETLLKDLLAEAPNLEHLLRILEHINFWVCSRDEQERLRALKASSSLLRHALFVVNVTDSSEPPNLGRIVAELGICITDPNWEISHRAREAVGWLYELLLMHKGLNLLEGKELWGHEFQEDEELQAYMDTIRMGEILRKLFSDPQKRSFLSTALLAIYHHCEQMREAGMLLIHALQGQASSQVPEKLEEMICGVQEDLYFLLNSKILPMAIKSLISY